MVFEWGFFADRISNCVFFAKHWSGEMDDVSLYLAGLVKDSYSNYEWGHYKKKISEKDL